MGRTRVGAGLVFVSQILTRTVSVFLQAGAGKGLVVFTGKFLNVSYLLSSVSMGLLIFFGGIHQQRWCIYVLACSPVYKCIVL